MYFCTYGNPKRRRVDTFVQTNWGGGAVNPRIGDMQIPDDEWERAAVEQLRADVRAHPGGARGFINDYGAQLEIGYEGFTKNLRTPGSMRYRTFVRAVHMLGYTTAEYDERIATRIDADRRRAGN